MGEFDHSTRHQNLSPGRMSAFHIWPLSKPGDEKGKQPRSEAIEPSASVACTLSGFGSTGPLVVTSADRREFSWCILCKHHEDLFLPTTLQTLPQYSHESA